MILKSSQSPSFREILTFWYSDEIRKYWYRSTPEFDAKVHELYLPLWQEAQAGELSHWNEEASSLAALVIVLDQFPLHMFRGRPESFASLSQAIAATRLAVSNGFDRALDQSMLGFLYMPLMHSESLQDQVLSVQLYREAGLTKNLRFAIHHHDLVKEFGRFPHRNSILGRQSTTEELDYLKSKRAFKG